MTQPVDSTPSSATTGRRYVQAPAEVPRPAANPRCRQGRPPLTADCGNGTAAPSGRRRDDDQPVAEAEAARRVVTSSGSRSGTGLALAAPVAAHCDSGPSAMQTVTVETDSPSDHDAVVRSRHERCPTAFIMRARRVEAHSLARDKDQLLRFASKTFTVEPDEETARHWFVQHLPPEEQLESAAARVRPLLLESEAVHHSKVMVALGYLLKSEGHEAARAVVAGLRREWQRFQPRGRDIQGSGVFS